MRTAHKGIKNDASIALNKSGLRVFIFISGLFGLLNTETGGIGMLPLTAETFTLTVPQAG